MKKKLIPFLITGAVVLVVLAIVSRVPKLRAAVMGS